MKRWGNSGVVERISMAYKMVHNVRGYQEEMARGGITAEKREEVLQLIKKARLLEEQKNSLYGDWLEKSEELEHAMKELHEEYSLIRNVIKLYVSKGSWGAFDIHDKR